MEREAILDLMAALCTTITSLDAMAGDLIATAAVLDAAPITGLMHGVAHGLQTDVLRLRAQLTTLLGEHLEQGEPRW